MEKQPRSAFLSILEKWWDTHPVSGPDVMLAAWRKRDALAGRRVEIRDPQRQILVGEIVIRD